MLGGQGDGAIGEGTGALEVAFDQAAKRHPEDCPAERPDLRLRLRQTEGIAHAFFRPGMVPEK